MDNSRTANGMCTIPPASNICVTLDFRRWFELKKTDADIYSIRAELRRVRQQPCLEIGSSSLFYPVITVWADFPMDQPFLTMVQIKHTKHIRKEGTQTYP